MRIFFTMSLAVISGVLSSCSIFFGNIRSVEEKSTQYSVEDLSKGRFHWKKTNSPPEIELTDGPRPDLVFESNQSAAVISLTSGCKGVTRTPQSEHNLAAYTRTLVMGIAELKFTEMKKFKIDQVDALWSSVSGTLNHAPVNLEIVVSQKDNCYYDLILVGPSPLSGSSLDDFRHFVSTFHFK